MNAQRRQIISEMRTLMAMTGKEAYEASKDPIYMRDWVRVSVRDNRIDGKPKRRPKPQSWRARLRFLKQMAAMQAKKLRQKQKPVVARGRRIQRMMDSGLSMIQALRIERKRRG